MAIYKCICGPGDIHERVLWLYIGPGDIHVCVLWLYIGPRDIHVRVLWLYIGVHLVPCVCELLYSYLGGCTCMLCMNLYRPYCMPSWYTCIICTNP